MVMKKISRKPPRWDQNDSIYFLTFCTFDRKRYLHRARIAEMIIENLEFYSKRVKDLIVYTILPDHIHLLVNVEKVAHMSAFLRDLKKHTSKEIKKMLAIKSLHVWQRGTMDHRIRVSPGSEDYTNHLNYIYYNSVKHPGIAPSQFPFHNFGKAISKGWIEEGFCTLMAELPKTFEVYEWRLFLK